MMYVADGVQVLLEAFKVCQSAYRFACETNEVQGV